MSNSVGFCQMAQAVNKSGLRYYIGPWSSNWQPVKPPEAISIKRRVTGNSGSGPFFKAEAKPYLEQDSPIYLLQGNRYLLAGEITSPQYGMGGLGGDCFHANGRTVDYCSVSIGSYGGRKTWITAVHWYHYFLDSNGRGRAIRTTASYSDGSGTRPIPYPAWREFPTPGMYPDLIPAFSNGVWSPYDESIRSDWGTYVQPLSNGLVINCYRQNYGPTNPTNLTSTNINGGFKIDEQGVNNSRFMFYQILDGPVWSSLYRDLVGNAYYDALGSLPEVSANTIANVKDLIDPLASAKKVLFGDFSPLVSLARNVSDPRNDWLTWRYVYNTTKMDLADYQSVTNRLLSLVGMCDKGFTSFKQDGYCRIGDYSAHFVGRFDITDFLPECWVPKEDGTYSKMDVGSFRQILETYGVRLNAANAWDMIPFSFMVDWFTHVGTTLERWDLEKRSHSFHMSEYWYSITYHGKNSYAYSRWNSSLPDVPPTYQSREVSDRTVIYRMADSVSIFT